MKVFDKMFDRVIRHEGGFQAIHGDRGNWTEGKVGKGELRGTKWGISAMSYPSLDIKNLTREDAKSIYYLDWWLRLDMDQFSPALAYQMFDAALNHGMDNATRMLQRAVGVKDDGKIGPVTRTAVGYADLNDLLKLFLAERLEFFTQVGTFNTFGKGWCRRIAENLRYAAEDTI